MEAPEIRYTRSKDGVRIAYGIHEGAGSPILSVPWPGQAPLPMAHEFRASRECLDAIRAGRPMIRLDFRGLGLSGPIGERLTVAEQAMDLEAACEATGEPLDAVVWCTGCFPAVKLAVERPELFRSLTLVAPDYEGCDSHYKALWDLRATMPDLQWAELIIRAGIDVPVADAPALARRWIEFAPGEALGAHIEASRRGSLVDLLPRLTIPTAVVSHQGSREQSALVAAAIPGCVFRSIENLYVNAKTGRQIRLAMEALQTRAEDCITASPQGDLPLTGREIEVLECIASGLTNPQIADKLSISRTTVATHIQNIYTKTGAHNRVEAANWAREHGVG